ncbi:MAG: LD-carboxypeptidase [Cyclobacteriaceae bacterium]|nr:LD-carboxypeptidase [Cyclobacteriaceae bacterium]
MIIPTLLAVKGKARIIAPSGIVPFKGVDVMVKTLKSWGLEVSFGRHLYEKSSVFAGTDPQRLSDFQEAIDDDQVDLILCARGGYGLARYIDNLNLAAFKKKPKWVVGFSDITAFHLRALKNNILSIHGPMGTSFGRKGGEESILALHNLLFNGFFQVESKRKQLRTGRANGCVVGGNLSLICDSLGTESEIDTDNKILVLEDVGDYYYRMDRMLNQLARAGKFEKLKGLVIGSFSDLINGEILFTESVEDMVFRCTERIKYPIALMPIGHEPANYPFVHGAEYNLVVKENNAILELITAL